MQFPILYKFAAAGVMLAVGTATAIVFAAGGTTGQAAASVPDVPADATSPTVIGKAKKPRTDIFDGSVNAPVPTTSASERGDSADPTAAPKPPGTSTPPPSSTPTQPAPAPSSPAPEPEPEPSNPPPTSEPEPSPPKKCYFLGIEVTCRN